MAGCADGPIFREAQTIIKRCLQAECADRHSFVPVTGKLAGELI